MNYPDLIFEVSWEVCNKVGGIYTVLSTHTSTLQSKMGQNLIFVGPDIWKNKNNNDFVENDSLCKEWQKAAHEANIPIRVGTWNVPGCPIAILVDFSKMYDQKNDIYAWAWEHYSVDSLHAYGDYDEASMFSIAAGKLIVAFFQNNLLNSYKKVVYHAHEWMTGLGLLWVKSYAPQIATVFTTHATSIGRSIAGNDKPLYDYFKGYHGNQMAEELSMQSKHSIERETAHAADCFTTVSDFTARECEQLLEIKPDEVLPNGFEDSFVPKSRSFTDQRKLGRKKILEVANALMGQNLDNKTIIISTSGRNDFRCKGFDVFVDSLVALKNKVQGRNILALIEVPCWCIGARKDLEQRIENPTIFAQALENPFVTHRINNFDDDRFIRLLREKGLTNQDASTVKVMLIPCYLDGNDGIFNMSYYQLLMANDLCIYPSYYEPWGYTPLESIAFKIPSITTDLSGFGQWIQSLGKGDDISDGVHVIHRTDSNYMDVVDSVCSDIVKFAELASTETTKLRRRASDLSKKALWKNFIIHYYKAYEKALEKSLQRINN